MKNPNFDSPVWQLLEVSQTRYADAAAAKTLTFGRLVTGGVTLEVMHGDFDTSQRATLVTVDSDKGRTMIEDYPGCSTVVSHNGHELPPSQQAPIIFLARKAVETV